LDGIVVLGSTGSIGVNTLKIAKRFGLQVEALVANKNTKLLNAQIQEFQPKYVAIGDETQKDKVAFKNPFCGEKGILALLEKASSQTVVNALVGYSGVMPSLKVQQLGKKLALANKESLVVAGKFLNASDIRPIDSEHFGLWYLRSEKKIAKMYITASGGALRDWSIEAIKHATVQDVLKHPNWSMGQKITVDSATMANKLFEILEVKWLFNANNIDAYIEEKSIVHALVEFVDGSTTAHFAGVDMQLPIAYALDKNVDESILPAVDLLKMGTLRFSQIDTQKYPLWKLKEYLLQNPDMGIVVNAANDLAVERFLAKQIAFSDISRYVFEAIERFDGFRLDSIEQIEAQNKAIRNFLLT
jgi:1-deoxy-D-xylulose-5-phosphate reductoisomerase